jgi:peptidyl-Asp metalloendopeptidase
MKTPLLPTLVLLALSASSGRPARGAEPQRLLTFIGSTKSAATAAPEAPAARLEQRVSLDLASLDGSPRLELLDGRVYDTQKTGFERRGPQDFTWRGKVLLDGKEVGQMTLSSYAGRSAATITLHGELYQIEPLADGGHRLVQMDESVLPGCAGGIAPPHLARQGGPRPKVGHAAADATTTLDVLALYSPAALTALRTEDAVRAVIQQEIDIGNTAYQNSQINARLRLVGVQQLANFTQQENGAAEDELTAFQADATAAALRRSAGADLVTLFVERMTDACGIGYIMNKEALGPDFAPYAYSVVRRACGYLTLPHELGHNLGCEHDPGDANDTPAEASFPYSYGHFESGKFHTIMTYPNACMPACDAIPYFSNPDVQYNGLATGLADQRDNHRTINNTRNIAANFGSLGPTAPCRPGPENLCLLNRRFKVELLWHNQYDGSSGTGKAIPRTDLAGFFTFGDPSNIELMIKILDFGNVVKVFYGQLTDLQFSLAVTDTTTGQVNSYSNTTGNCGAIDQSAFSGSTGGASLASRLADPPTFARAAASGSCRPGANTLCLGEGRFAVSVDWANPGNGTSGHGGAVPLSSVTGAFYFTDASNLELLGKIIDFGDRIAFFYGTLSDLDYTLNVQDTVNGTTKSYHNPGGTFCGGLDNHAF